MNKRHCIIVVVCLMGIFDALAALNNGDPLTASQDRCPVYLLFDMWTNSMGKNAVATNNSPYTNMTAERLWAVLPELKPSDSDADKLDSARLLQWCMAMSKCDSNYLCKLPINVHGIVLDRGDKPVTMAVVTGEYSSLHTGCAVFKYYVTTTDSNGRFAITNLYGHFGEVWAGKSGYSGFAASRDSFASTDLGFPLFAPSFNSRRIVLRLVNNMELYGNYANMTAAQLWKARPQWRTNATPEELADCRLWTTVVKKKALFLLSIAPIEFYGVVQDYDSNTVPAAIISASWDGTNDNEQERCDITADSNGLFAITNICGQSLDIAVRNAGYASGRAAKSSFNYGDVSGSVHIPDKAQPVVFRIKKKDELAPLIKTSSKIGRFPINSVPQWHDRWYDVSKLAITTNLATFGFSVVSAITNIPYEPFAYTIIIHASPGAGVVLNKDDEFMFEAPAAEYTNAIEIKVVPGSNFAVSKRLEFFFRTREGNYGACFAECQVGFGLRGVEVRVMTIMNPTGSRNLTYKYFY